VRLVSRTPLMRRASREEGGKTAREGFMLFLMPCLADWM